EVSNVELNFRSNPTIRPLVTFVDDDGSGKVWTVLKPMFESRGVPYTLALQVTGKSLTTEQALYLQNELGWEIASHGMQQIQLNDLTEEEAIYQLRESKKVLTEQGFNVKHYVYGYGYPNQITRNLTRKYYKSGANA